MYKLKYGGPQKKTEQDAAKSQKTRFRKKGQHSPLTLHSQGPQGSDFPGPFPDNHGKGVSHPHHNNT